MIANMRQEELPWLNSVLGEYVIGRFGLRSGNSELKKADKNLPASHHFLQIANCHKEMNPLLNEFIIEIKNLTGCCAVGMRGNL